MQLSLLDSLPPRPDVTFGTTRRIDLGAGAWVEHSPGWLSGHTQIFDQLLRTADWERHLRQMYDRVVEVPRLVAKLPGEKPGLAWNDEVVVELLRHRSPSRDVRAAGDRLRLMAVELSHRYRKTLTSVSLAYYRDGNDSVAYHGDKLGPLRRDTVVAICSVGAQRKFLMRPTGGGQSRSFMVGEGDLLVMGGNCQETWEHAIPKARTAGPRIAIMFREHMPAVASLRSSRASRAGTERPASAAASRAASRSTLASTSRGTRRSSAESSMSLAGPSH